MGEILLGIFAVLVGGLFALQGGNLMRILFPFLGFFAGLSAGAGMVSSWSGDGFLSTVFGWVVGICIGLLFALLAYFYYAFAVVLAFAGLGFSLAALLLSLFNMDWNWLVILLGTAAAVAFGFFAVISSLPMTVLIVVTSFFGASMIVYGVMLVLNLASFGDFSNGEVYRTIHDHIGLYLLWMLFGIMASFTQIRILGEQTALAQEYWNNALTYGELQTGVAPEKPAKAKKTKKS